MMNWIPLSPAARPADFDGYLSLHVNDNEDISVLYLIKMKDQSKEEKTKLQVLLTE